jgi:Concanavalin A-like lectin/glucanases superfamily
VRVLLAGLLVTTAATVTACGGSFGLLWHEDGETPEGTPQRTVLVAHDSSGNHHDGVIQGKPALGLPGHRGTSYSFDLRGSWVEVPSTPALNPEKGDFSLSMWVNFGSAPHGMHTYDIVRKGLSYTRTGEYKLEIIHGGLVRCTTKDVDGDRARISARGHPVTDGQWHRVGCSRAGSRWTVHVDGWSATERDRLGEISNTMPLSIGSKYGLEDMPQGRADEVRLRIEGRTVGLWHLDERPAPTG